MALELRELTEAEIDQVYGGDGVIIVTAPRPGGGTYTGGGGWYGGGGGDGSSSDPRLYEDPDPEVPDCFNSQPVTLESGTVPDNAKYYLPEGVGAAYLQGAINHIVEIHNNNIANMGAVYAELNSMYTDPSNPYFVDFKDWGSTSGPSGGVDGGDITYYSDAAGGEITADAFEPFGNYFFGFICTMAGLSPEETWAVAAGVQTGGFGDDPQDSVHVTKGIAEAQAFLAGNTTPPIVIQSDCSVTFGQ
jgi:hypothetical protein